MIRALGLVNGTSTMTISDQGIKISVDTLSHACQGHVFLTTALFSSYKFAEPEGYAAFGVNLPALTQCLQMFAKDDAASTGAGDEPGILSSTSVCTLTYAGPGSPLVMSFREGRNMTTTCEFTTYETDDGEDDDYAENDGIRLAVDDIVQKIIIRGDIMHDAFSELDGIGTSVLTVRASSKIEPHFQLVSHGALGSTDLVFPNEKRVLESFVVVPPSSEAHHRPRSSAYHDEPNIVISNNYSFDLIKMAKEAVALASKVSLRCDSKGVMSLQSLCENDGRRSFIDFRFLPSDS